MKISRGRCMDSLGFYPAAIFNLE